MRFAKRGVVSLILISFCAACGARAQSQASQTEVKSFVTQYVAAFNAKGAARLRALQHPKSLACITAENKSFYDDLLAVHRRDPIPANYTFKASPVNENNLKALETMGWFPVKPDRELQIDYQQGDDGGSITVYLIRENGRLFDDEPCASDQTVKHYNDDAPARAERLAQDKALAAAIKEPLRSDLIALLREHKTAEATTRYKEASGQDYPTAMFVIDLLVPEARP
jgi:hypothetical protein